MEKGQLEQQGRLEGDPGANTCSLPLALIQRTAWRPLAIRSSRKLLAGLSARISGFLGHEIRISNWVADLSGSRVISNGRGPLAAIVSPVLGQGQADRMSSSRVTVKASITGDGAAFQMSPIANALLAEASRARKIRGRLRQVLSESKHQAAGERTTASDTEGEEVEDGISAVATRRPLNARSHAAALVRNALPLKLASPSTRPGRVPMRPYSPSAKAGFMRMTAGAAPHRRREIPFLSLPVDLEIPRPVSRLVPLSIVHRREKPGGFPRSRPELMPIGHPIAGTAEISRQIRSNDQRPAKEAAEGGDLVERLFALASANRPLQGLRMAMVQPRQPPSAPETRKNAIGGKGAWGSEPTPAEAHVASKQAAPPSPDINAIAEKVLQTLQRRERIERERRGII